MQYISPPRISLTSRKRCCQVHLHYIKCKLSENIASELKATRENVETYNRWRYRLNENAPLDLRLGSFLTYLIAWNQVTLSTTSRAENETYLSPRVNVTSANARKTLSIFPHTIKRFSEARRSSFNSVRCHDINSEQLLSRNKVKRLLYGVPSIWLIINYLFKLH